MNENTEKREVTAEERRNILAKWLRILFYIHIASLVISIISFLPISDEWTAWFSRAITIGSILCLFQLTSAHGRYRKAAIFRTVFLLGTWINGLLSSSVLLLAASVCSLVSVYQEYSAHSDIVAERDPRLSQKWHSLFHWQIAVGILISLSSMVAILIVVFLEVDTVTAQTVIVGILSVPDVILRILYLLYLNRMIQLIQE